MLKAIIWAFVGLLVLTALAVAFPFGGAPPGGTPPPPPGDQMASCLATMSSNTWKAASSCVGINTTLRSVAWNCTAQPCGSNGQPGTPSDAPTTASLVGSSDVSGVMTDWGGGNYDSDDKLLIVWGGGHLGYYGNELYGFGLADLQWHRLSVPSSLNGFVKGGNVSVMPDGNPIAPHTYNGPAYVPGTGLFQIGTAANDNGNSTGQSWKQVVSALSPTAYNHWVAIASIGNYLPGQITAFDPSSSKLYVWGGFSSVPLAALASPYTGAWVTTGGNGDTNGTVAGAVQPGVEFVAAGANASTTTGFLAANLSTGSEITRTATGDTSVTSCSVPGFVWDPTGSQFIGWCGGKNLVMLNPSTNVFTLLVGGGAVTPQCSDATHCTSASGTLQNGTYGRFQCLRPVYPACIAVNTVDDSVYIYKF